jgi:outer membrane protein
MKLRIGSVCCLALTLGFAAGLVQAGDLHDLYQAAKQNDADFQQAQATWSAAQEASPQARAALLPQVGVEAGIQRHWNSSGSPAAGNQQTLSAGIGLTQQLFHYDRWLSLSRADRVLARASAELDSAQQALLLSVFERYIAALKAQDELTFAQADKRAIENHLEQTRKRFEVGLIAVTEVHEGQARYDLTAAAELANLQQLESAYEALRELTNNHVNKVANFNNDISLQNPDPPHAEHWASLATKQNSLVRSALVASEIASLDIGVAKASRLPTLDLIGSTKQVEYDPDATDISGLQSTLSLQLSVPLYTGGATSSKIRQAGAEYNAALAALNGAKLNAARQARDAYRSIGTAIKQVQAYQQAVRSGESALRATQAGFDVGTRTIVDVLDAERELHRAQRDLKHAKYQYLQSWVNLKASTGTLSEQDLSELDQQLK